MAPKIILASRSPARKKLMQELGLPFECHASEINENMEARKDPQELAMHLAALKAENVASKYPDSIIIGVDTFIVIGKEKIGKPHTVKEAAKILQKMSGKKIRVISGLAVLITDSKGRKKKEYISHCVTILKMKKMRTQEIRYFSRKKEALAVSGAISIEGESGKLVEEVHGDYHNVIGLPLQQLKEILSRLYTFHKQAAP